MLHDPGIRSFAVAIQVQGGAHEEASAILRISALSSAVVVFLGTCFITLAGFPATTVYGGTSCCNHISNLSLLLVHTCQLTLVTTLPAPTVLPRPTLTPGRMVTLPPIHTSSSMTISLPSSGPFVPFRRSGSRGWVPEYKETLGASNVLEPIETRQVSIIVQLKLMKTPSPNRRFVPKSAWKGGSTQGWSASNASSSSSVLPSLRGGRGVVSPTILEDAKHCALETRIEWTRTIWTRFDLLFPHLNLPSSSHGVIFTRTVVSHTCPTASATLCN